MKKDRFINMFMATVDQNTLDVPYQGQIAGQMLPNIYLVKGFIYDLDIDHPSESDIEFTGENRTIAQHHLFNDPDIVLFSTIEEMDSHIKKMLTPIPN